jgi:hypothetical protein
VLRSCDSERLKGFHAVMTTAATAPRLASQRSCVPTGFANDHTAG